MERPSWAPDEIDLDRPSAARVYDFYLGGSHNFAVDRQLGRQAIAIIPQLPQIMQANRAFLRRALRCLIDAGIEQFIDIGSGIPTAGNVHEVAQQLNPDARVVYVDTDPIAVAHSRAILAGDERSTVIEADLRQPDGVLNHPELGQLIDLSAPVGLLMVAVLHFIPDRDDPAAALARYRHAIAPGSFLVVSHGTQEGLPEHSVRMEELYARSPSPLTPRTRHQLSTMITTAGFELVEPGVVFLPLWRPDNPDDPDELAEHPEQSCTYAGVGQI